MEPNSAQLLFQQHFTRRYEVRKNRRYFANESHCDEGLPGAHKSSALPPVVEALHAGHEQWRRGSLGQDELRENKDDEKLARGGLRAPFELAEHLSTEESSTPLDAANGNDAAANARNKGQHDGGDCRKLGALVPDSDADEEAMHDSGSEGDDEDNDDETTYSMSFAFILPLALTDEYRARHQLSVADLKCILRVMDVQFLWMLAIYHGREITTSAILPSSGSASASASTSSAHHGGGVDVGAGAGASGNGNGNDICFSGNTTGIVNKLLDHLASSGALAPCSRLIAKHDQHNPRLPVHFVTDEEWRRLAAVLPPSSAAHCYHRFAYQWQDIYVLPSRHYNGYLEMVRVLPRHVHVRVFGRANNLIQRDNEFLIGNVVYCATPELMLVQTHANHALLNRLPEQAVLSHYATALMDHNDQAHLQYVFQDSNVRLSRAERAQSSGADTAGARLAKLDSVQCGGIGAKFTPVALSQLHGTGDTDPPPP